MIAMYLANQMTAASLQEMGQSSEENTTRRFCIRIVKIDEQCHSINDNCSETS